MNVRSPPTDSGTSTSSTGISSSGRSMDSDSDPSPGVGSSESSSWSSPNPPNGSPDRIASSADGVGSRPASGATSGSASGGASNVVCSNPTMMSESWWLTNWSDCGMSSAGNSPKLSARSSPSTGSMSGDGSISACELMNGTSTSSVISSGSGSGAGGGAAGWAGFAGAAGAGGGAALARAPAEPARGESKLTSRKTRSFALGVG